MQKRQADGLQNITLHYGQFVIAWNLRIKNALERQELYENKSYLASRLEGVKVRNYVTVYLDSNVE